MNGQRKLSHVSNHHPRRVTSVARSMDSSSSNNVDPPFRTRLVICAMPTLEYTDQLRMPGESIELELSFGVLFSGYFHEGVRMQDWMRLEQLAQAAPLVEPVRKESSTDYHYNDTSELLAAHAIALPRLPPFSRSVVSNTPRLIVSTGSAGTVARCQFKAPCDIQTLSAPKSYDTRVHINYERSVPLLASRLSTVPAGWIESRMKTRTIRRLQCAPDWEMHLTLVIPGSGDDTHFEVEFKYMPQTPLAGTIMQRRELLAASVRNLSAVMIELTSVIHGRARQLGPSSLPPLVCELIAVDYQNGRDIDRICQRCYPPDQARRPVFAGVTPHDLTRSVLDLLRADSTNAMAVEKTDGHRLMMVLLENRGLFFVNHDNCISTLDARYSHFVAALHTRIGVCNLGATVLDGELARRHGRVESYTFVALDALMLNGQPMHTTPLARRADLLHEFITKLVRPAVESLGSSATIPFDFRAKRYLPLSLARALVRRTTVVPDGTTVFRYDDTHLFTVDGFILVHSSVGQRERHYKWTPPSRLAVDFLLTKRAGTTFGLEVATDSELTMTVANISFTDQEMYTMTCVQLDSELSTRMQPPMAQMHGLPIVRCAYDANNACWRFVSFCTDKRRPHHAREWAATVLAMINPIQLDELFGPVVK